MEVARLTAVLEAQTTKFEASMKTVTSALNSVQKQIKQTEVVVKALSESLKDVKMSEKNRVETQRILDAYARDLERVSKIAKETKHAIEEVKITTTPAEAIATATKVRELHEIRDAAIEAALAEQRVQTRMASGRWGPKAIPLGSVSRQVGGMEAYRQYLQMLVESGAPTGPGGVQQSLPHLGPPSLQQYLGRYATPRPGMPLRGPFAAGEDVLRPYGGGIFAGSYDPLSRINELGKGDIAGARKRLREAGIEERGGLFGGFRGGGGGGSGRRGRYNVPGPDILAGILPGGSRARPAALAVAAGVVSTLGPAAVPATAGLGMAAAAGITALLGAMGTLKLAFADISGAAFTTQAAFNALTPVQKSFVQNLREVDAGFMKPLERLAQKRVLPGLTAGINAALTPASISAISGGVSAFGGAIGREAKELGQLFGSTQFAESFGRVLKADARILDDMLDVATRLFDAFVHLSEAAIPLNRWLGDQAVKLGAWIDNAVVAAQKSGRLAHFFTEAKIALQAFGNLLRSVGHILGAVLGSIGFENSINSIKLFTRAFETLAQFISANQAVISGFIAGLIQAANDLISALKPIAGLVTNIANSLRKLIKPLSDATNGVIGLRGAIDALLIMMGLRWLGTLGRATKAATGVVDTLGLRTGIAAGAVVAAKKVGLLRGALIGLARLPQILIPILIYETIFNKKGFDKQVTQWMRGHGMGALTGTTYDSIDALRKAAAGGGLPAKLLQDMERAAAAGDPTAKALLAGGEIDPTTGKPVGPVKRLPFGGDTIGAGFAPTPGGSQFGGDFGGVNPLAVGGAAGHAKPPPLQGTGKAGVLPTAYETAILVAQNSGNVSAQRKAINNAIAWIARRLPRIKDATLKNLYLQESISLKGELAGLAGSPSAQFGAPTSAGGAVFNAQQRLIGAMTPGSGVPFSKQLQLAKDYLAVTIKAEEHLRGVAVTAKTRSAHQAALTRLARDETSARKDIITIHERQSKNQLKLATDAVTTAKQTEAAAIAGATTDREKIRAANTYLAVLARQLKVLQAQLKAGRDTAAIHKEIKHIHAEEHRAHAAVHATRMQRTWERLLGIGPGTTPSAQGVIRREHSTLTGILKSLPHAHGVSPMSLIPGFARMTVNQQIHALQAHGVEFSKRALKQFELFHKILAQSMKSGIPLTGDAVNKMIAVLAQIKDNTDPKKQAIPSYHLASVKSVMASLAGTIKDPAKRKAAAQRLMEMEIYGGHLPIGPAVAGIPVRHAGHNVSVTHGGVHIVIQGYEKDPKVLAAEVRAALLKTHRRNPTQTRGPNAGRNLGLS